MFGRIGTGELILILAIALVVVGPSKLPELGKTLGKTLKEFKKFSNEIKEDLSLEEKKENVKVEKDKAQDKVEKAELTEENTKSQD